MKRALLKCLLVGILIMVFGVSCGTTSVEHTWKDATYSEKIQSVLIIGVAEVDFMRSQFENVLAIRLAERKIKAIPSHTIFPGDAKKISREAVVAKVRELGIGNVIVARVLSKQERSHLIKGGYFEVPVEWQDNFYNTYATTVVPISIQGSAYDAEFFDMAVNVYDSKSEKLVWSELLRVKVENSRQGALNPFIDVLVSHMASSRLI